MVKYLRHPYTPDTYVVTFAPWGGYMLETPIDATTVWVYPTAGDLWMYSGWIAGFNPVEAEAILMALDLVAHNQVLVDLDPETHGSLSQGQYCPMVPRWNIYRGQRGQPLRGAVYADCFWDIPR
jgi:hypothetical protein